MTSLQRNNLHSIIQDLCPPFETIETHLKPSVNNLSNIKAVVFDVYGTLFASSAGDISHSNEDNRSHSLLKTLNHFNITVPAKYDIGVNFIDCIKSQQQIVREKGVEFPEIDILEVWVTFLNTLEIEIPESDILAQIAVYYECTANRVFPIPDLLKTIEALHSNNIVLGIVSNAQFFTPLLFSAFLNKDLSQLGFNPNHCIWSYKLKEAKPSKKLYQLCAQSLKTHNNISTSETLFVGNDMLNDIYPSQSEGYKTALFAGDKRSLRLRETNKYCKNIKPDITITQLPQILKCIL